MGYTEELLNEIANDMKLSYIDRENFIHDFNNLRGDEWLDEVKTKCSMRLSNSYENALSKMTLDEDELIDNMERGYY